MLQQIENFGDGRFRRTMPSGRSRAGGTGSRGPSRSCRPAAGDARAHRSRRMRAGDAGAAPGRADRGLRLSRGVLPKRALAAAPPRPMRASSPAAADLWRRAKAPLIIAGGGVHYSLACDALADFAERHGIPVAETQAGKGALPWDHPWPRAAIGVTGASAANALAAEADVILGVGTRLSDFTTASRACSKIPNGAAHPAQRRRLRRGKARRVAAGRGRQGRARGASARRSAGPRRRRRWTTRRAQLMPPGMPRSSARPPPAMRRSLGRPGARRGQSRAPARTTSSSAPPAGLPGELHKLWRVRLPGTYHMEYGYSCMGYEIAGGLGVKLAEPEREVCAGG